MLWYVQLPSRTSSSIYYSCLLDVEVGGITFSLAGLESSFHFAAQRIGAGARFASRELNRGDVLKHVRYQRPLRRDLIVSIAIYPSLANAEILPKRHPSSAPR
jgi:hypothetical protein